jgi:hypothetical protein
MSIYQNMKLSLREETCYENWNYQYGDRAQLLLMNLLQRSYDGCYHYIC